MSTTAKIIQFPAQIKPKAIQAAKAAKPVAAVTVHQMRRAA